MTTPPHRSAPTLLVVWALLSVGLVPGCPSGPADDRPPAPPRVGAPRTIRTDDGRSPRWRWPTGGREVVRGWERPADDYAAGHRGIDVAAAVGTTVVAVADGRVSFAGQVGGRSVVSIDHGGGLVSTVDSVTPSVAAGSLVARGDPVGTVAVGHCPASAPCLHLGARVDGRYVDPLPYLPAADWPVLLPESAWPG